MSKVNSNVKYLKALVAPKSKFRDQQHEVIRLYQERKIENVKTAEKIIEQLHSRGQKKNEQGLASLSKYSTTVPATGKISRQLETKTKKAQPIITKVDRTNDNNALSSLVFHINQSKLYQVSDIVRASTVVDEIKAMMKRKKSMKMHLGAKFEICRTAEYEDGEVKLGADGKLVIEVDEHGHEAHLEVKVNKQFSVPVVSVQPHNLINISDDSRSARTATPSLLLLLLLLFLLLLFLLLLLL